MTDAELNAEIARMRGWTRREGAWYCNNREPEAIGDWWSRFAFGEDAPPTWDKSDAPPFASEWALCGVLFEEAMLAVGHEPGYMSTPDSWTATSGGTGGMWEHGEFPDAASHGIIIANAPTPRRAVALAWLAWAREHLAECKGCEACKHLVRVAA